MMASLMKLGTRPMYLMAFKKMLKMKIVHIIIELISCGVKFKNLKSQGHW